VAAFEEGEDVELRPHKQSKRRKDFVKKKKGTTAPVLEQHGLLCAQLLRIRSEEPASCNFETELGL
jgi:hypothetical protein